MSFPIPLRRASSFHYQDGPKETPRNLGSLADIEAQDKRADLINAQAGKEAVPFVNQAQAIATSFHNDAAEAKAMAAAAHAMHGAGSLQAEMEAIRASLAQSGVAHTTPKDLNVLAEGANAVVHGQQRSNTGLLGVRG